MKKQRNYNYWTNIVPSKDYDSLLKQFSAMKTLAWSLEQQLNVYRDKEYEERMAYLQLDSERAVNEILTNEIDILKAKIKVLEEK